MKFQKLNLLAYGPFTDHALDLSHDSFGLHVVYGPNEAGKSSALRAIENFLFGFPHITTDNFLHPNTKLRIEATLTDETGANHIFSRKKARKNSLLDEENSPVQDERFAEMLGGLTPETFRALFGLDFKTLSEGGEELLLSGGGLGQSLFAAGSGISGLRNIVEKLKNDQEDLYKRNGKNPQLNSSLKALRDLKKQLREQSTKPQDVLDIERQIQDISTQKERVTEKLRELRKNRNRLERISSALKTVQDRQRLHAELAPLTEVPSLSEAFRENLATNRIALASEERSLAEQHKEQDRLLALRSAVNSPDELLAESQYILNLDERRQRLVAAEEERPRLTAQQEHSTRSAQEMLSRLGSSASLDEARALCPNRQDRVRIHELGGKLTELDARIEKTQSDLSEITMRLDAAQQSAKALPQPFSLAALAASVEAASCQGNLVQQYQDATLRLKSKEQRFEEALQRLPLWAGSDPAELFQLTLPLPEQVQQHHKIQEQHSTESDKLNDRLHQVTESIRSKKHRLAELQGEGKTPGSADIQQARTERDQSWQRLRSALDHSEPLSPEESTPLAAGFEQQLLRTDEMADRRFEHADLVSQKAALDREITQLTKQEEELLARLAQQQDQQTLETRAWHALWEDCPFTPLSPAEMQDWLKHLGSLSQLYADVQEQLRIQQSISERATRFKEEIRACFSSVESCSQPGSTDSLDTLLSLANNLLNENKERERQQQHIQLSIQQLEQEQSKVMRLLREDQSQREALAAQWSDALTHLGLSPVSTPAQAIAALEDYTDLERRLAELQDAQAKLSAQDEQRKEFEATAGALCRRFFPEPQHMGSGFDAVLKNFGKLVHQLRTIEDASQQLKVLGLSMQERHESVQKLRDERAAFCEEARVDSPEQLQGALEKGLHKAQLTLELKGIEEQFLEKCGTDDPAEFTAAVLSANHDELHTELLELGHQLTELEAQRSNCEQELGGLKEKRRAFDGGSQAAELAEQAEQARARIQAQAERYIKLSLASSILQHEIEEYRRTHQGPVLNKASEIFANLTLSAFSGVQADINADGDPVITGRRASGDLLDVSAMSDGTRDQLFLSLRLAALWHYLEQNPPVPLIVDDILVHFDDQRSQATLKELAKLAEKTQVIFFTHHQRLCQLAEAAVSPQLLRQHEL